MLLVTTPFRNTPIASLLKAILLCCLFALGAGCGGKKGLKEEIPCSERYAAAKAKYDAGRYDDAKDILHEILYRCTGRNETVLIIHHLGMSYYRLKQYDQAEYQFRDILRDFHSDSLAGTAQFMVGKSLFAQSRRAERDQSETREAIVEFKKVSEDFPNSPFADSAKVYVSRCRAKMAEKDFRSARLYQKMHEHKAAIVYFKDLLTEYGDTQWAPTAQYYLAYSLAKDQKPQDAVAICRELLAGTIADDLRDKTRKLLGQLEN